MNKNIVMVRKTASSKIVKFMVPGSGFLLLGRGSKNYIKKIHQFNWNLFPLLRSIRPMN